jgi:hypothetical protein
MLDSRLQRESQSDSGTAVRESGRSRESMTLLASPLLFQGYVGKDYEELIFVILTLGFSMALMVAFGAWWSR